MADPYRDEGAAAGPSEARVREALRAWARSVTFAPRRLDEQITSIDARDDVIVRVATEIVRRDLVERRVAAHPRAQRTGNTVHESTIDPFGGSLQDIRTQTEHSARCTSCEGSGLAGCPACHGTGRATCSGCGGSGRTYAKSTRGAKCKECRETGRVHCLRCNGTAKVACDGCGGAGQQLVWWEYVETVRTVFAFLSDSPVLRAHRHLCEQRFLSPHDLEHFTPFVTVQRTALIPHDALEPKDADTLARIAPATDPRLERVRAQQYLRFGVVRRDVRYEMCGMTGTVTLSGATLLGANTKDASRPIHVRLGLLVAESIMLIVLAVSWYASFSGSTAYFAASNHMITAVLIVGVAAALMATSAALRRLRPGFRWWPSNRFEHVYAALFVAAFASAPLITLVSRPTIAEARAAITAGDIARAEVVVEALKATRSAADVTEVSDELTLAEAERLSGDARIAKLDEAAAHPGQRAGEARDRARQARVDAVQAALAARQPAEALAQLDRWSAALATAPEASELRAQAYDQKAAACTDAACSFLTARSAEVAHTSPTRSQALSTARQQVLAALEPKEASDPDALKRIRALRGAAAIGSAVLADTPDPELSPKATAAVAAVGAQVAKVLLLGAPTALVNEVLERPKPGSPLIGWRELDGVAVYSADVAGLCTGLYVIGAAAGARGLSGKEAGLQRLLTQATGRPTAAIQPRPRSPKEQEVSRWVEGATQVLARWNGEALMELRIGNATP